MKLVTWNVNSIRARLDRALELLDRHRPDVLCLQELKVTADAFPREEFEKAGYRAAVHGQKTYNGVAILARGEPADVRRGFEDGLEDEQARLVSATVAGVRVLCAYVPNGQSVGSDKWSYKLRWLDRLRRYLEARHSPSEPLVLCGDLNVAPQERDVHDPLLWEGEVLFHPEARRSLAAVAGWGLVDTFRLHHAEGGLYSWWDYRQGAFHRNWGLRIDHILATRPLAARCTSAEIDRDERKGQQPSDHAPGLATFGS